MSDQSAWKVESSLPDRSRRGTGIGLVVALAALAAIGAGVVIQQILERRLSRREVARLRFLRYLRERGHLES
jgi:hypothetical protein